MNKIILPLAVCFLSGCSIQKNWVATGGSKSDSTVKLSYEYATFQKPIVSAQQGLDEAKKRCERWGYSDAEAFGGSTRACNYYSSAGCESWLVTKEYQCIK